MNFSFIRDRRSFSDFIFILWAGGAALLSYSLVYALRKPFTAATFDGLSIWGMDYKVVVTITQILGYLLAKFIGIELISAGFGMYVGSDFQFYRRAAGNGYASQFIGD